MKQLMLTLLSFLSFSLLTLAQNNQFSSPSDSDPEAKAVLEKLKGKYDAYKSIQADFSLSIELPEQPAEVQKGTLTREGDKYFMKMGNQDIMSDGKALYFILHNNKEVQISDLPEEQEEGSILSPQSLFSLYDSDKFVYLLANEIDKGGAVVQQIEMKPLDRYADYSKVRMEVNKNKTEIMNITAFGKDGSRYVFSLDKVVPNKQIPAGFFTFDKSKYPDYYIEDLRF